MLRYIEITNIALIDRASIEFGAGLCVLTGETGAGKSIIIDSINAALGAKTQKDLARSGSGGANVTAVFELGESYVKSQLRELLEENGLIEGSAGDGPAPRAEEIILSRDIGPSGRNTSRVNGRLVSSATLRAIGELIVDLHGQHENHSLMKRDRHIEMIDNYCGAGFLALRDEYSELYSRYFRVKRQIADLRRSESERVREIDILTYQLNEIKSVRPQAREDERLIEQIETLANAEKINNALDAAYALLRGGEDGGRDAPSAIGGVGESIRAVSQITAYSNDFAELSARLSEAKFLLEDIAATIRNKREAEDRDPGGLDKLSARLEAIERLKKKYGGTVREIHRFYKQSAERLAVLENSAQTIGELESELRGLHGKLTERADALTRMRKEAAAAIESGVVSELSALEMANCRFTVAIESADNVEGFNMKGRDQLEFLFCANPGEELKPLARIASGGEMSRVMLAIKSVLVGADNIPTMIFDEIDSGISGKAASRVAEKMHLLSRGRQIICVTHLAQIACMADEQYMIEKTATQTETQTRVHRLGSGRRADEIARMLGGGAPTEASLRLSGELLSRADSFKRAQGARG